MLLRAHVFMFIGVYVNISTLNISHCSLSNVIFYFFNLNHCASCPFCTIHREYYFVAILPLLGEQT